MARDGETRCILMLLTQLHLLPKESPDETIEIVYSYVVIQEVHRAHVSLYYIMLNFKVHFIKRTISISSVTTLRCWHNVDQ